VRFRECGNVVTLTRRVPDVNPYIPGGGGAQWFGPTNTLCVSRLHSTLQVFL